MRNINEEWLDMVQGYLDIIRMERIDNVDMDSVVSAEYAMAGGFIIEHREYITSESKWLDELFRKLDMNGEFVEYITYDIGAYCMNKPFWISFKEVDDGISNDKIESN